jgi:hypothetical protein
MTLGKKYLPANISATQNTLMHTNSPDKLLCRLAPLLVQARELNWKIEANQCY